MNTNTITFVVFTNTGGGGLGILDVPATQAQSGSSKAQAGQGQVQAGQRQTSGKEDFWAGACAGFTIGFILTAILFWRMLGPILAKDPEVTAEEDKKGLDAER